MISKNVSSLKTSLTSTLLALLTGCATTTQVVPKVVEVPVPISCVNDTPTRPVKAIGSDTRQRLGNTFIYVEELEKYADRLETIVAGCG